MLDFGWFWGNRGNLFSQKVEWVSFWVSLHLGLRILDASKNLAQDWMKAQLIDTEIANFQVSNYPLVNVYITMENHHV